MIVGQGLLSRGCRLWLPWGDGRVCWVVGGLCSFCNEVDGSYWVLLRAQCLVCSVGDS